MANLVHRRGVRAKVARARGVVVEYLAFRLDTDLYAVPVATIREIVRPPPSRRFRERHASFWGS